ncbi:hypothetical protein L2W58_12940 [Dethiosulfovibrio sp. F2B]|uniref:hypothetical protein n=1 Tax=Dethiosulfovibrio faecalis TaxID=2720018 RepID=UPI001F2A69C1|nr:hypothetical protein [Dethiosulfovibrio faecalis]MCF4152701.1 hypothetical protein [Dethiosulfovibrio faecalis]
MSTVKDLLERIASYVDKDERWLDSEIECSVDMSVDGDEATYGDRVFGSSVCAIEPVNEGPNGAPVALTICFELEEKVP